MHTIRYAFACLVTALLWSAHAHAQTQTFDELQRKYHISDADMKKLKGLVAATPNALGQKTLPAAQSKPHSTLVAKAPALTGATAQTSSWDFLLRQDWQDIGILSGPTPVDKATGATISYSNDQIAKNETWATHGTAAVVYTNIDDEGPGQVTPFYKSFAAYTTVNKLYNSAVSLASKNVDTISGGGAWEIGWDNAAAQTQNYFQFRAGAVQDNILGTTAANVTAAWIPVDNNHHIHHPEELIGTLGYSFDPEVLIQYASTTSAKSVLPFSNHDEAMRVGPQLSLLVFSYLKDDSFLSHLSANLTYHWWYEAIYGSQNHWLNASITYNFDSAGYFGLTVSYQNGQTEDAGKSTNLFMISLSAKH